VEDRLQHLIRRFRYWVKNLTRGQAILGTILCFLAAFGCFRTGTIDIDNYRGALAAQLRADSAAAFDTVPDVIASDRELYSSWDKAHTADLNRWFAEIGDVDRYEIPWNDRDRDLQYLAIGIGIAWILSAWCWLGPEDRRSS